MPCDILLINPPFLTLTSTLGVGHQVPLGLLMVGGALIDAGFAVCLLDAELEHLNGNAIVAAVEKLAPRIVMTGHAGSTPSHPVCIDMLRAIKAAFPHITTIYGGPYPTYHAQEILEREDAVDFIVRGEGEATAVALVRALEEGTALEHVQSIAFRPGRSTCFGMARSSGFSLSRNSAETRTNRQHAHVTLTPEREPLDMNHFRIGWELLDQNNSWDRYQCFGLGRAVIVQFSRGCPHQCTYCGQRGFWMQWRHRDPIALVDEIEWLATKRDVRFITLADENPTTLRHEWKRFLQELARRELPVKFFATIRATDIVRDADLMPLYHAAGIQYILMGIETTDPATLKKIKKGSTTRVDFQACKLLREHGIFSIIGHIVGLGRERWIDFFHAARQLAAYDGDYLNCMYVTPHAWTRFAGDSRDRGVIDRDLRRWDYRHQVLEQTHMRPWELFAAVKILELIFHLRPRRIWRLLTQNAFSRQQFVWGLSHTALVWLAEISDFISTLRHHGGTLREFNRKPIGESRHNDRIHLRITRTSQVRSSAFRRLRGASVD